MVSTGLRRLTAGAVVAGGAVCLAIVCAQAQGATSRLPDGHPDLNGMWYHRIGAPAPQVKPGESYDAVNAPRGQVTQYPVGRPKYKPEFVAKVKDLDERQVDLDPAWVLSATRRAAHRAAAENHADVERDRLPLR